MLQVMSLSSRDEKDIDILLTDLLNFLHEGLSHLLGEWRMGEWRMRNKRSQ
jgi:hypothetical protein